MAGNGDRQTHTHTTQAYLLKKNIWPNKKQEQEHEQVRKITEDSACSCGFINEDEFHFFFCMSFILYAKNHTS